MRQRTTWQNAIVLTLFGAAIATACVVSSDSDGVDDDDGGSGGFGNSSSKGGSSGKGGKGGSGGSTSAGGDTSEGGDTGTSGGAPAGGAGPTAECDPAPVGGGGGASPVAGTPWPDCAPSDADNDCQVCIQENCCEEQMNCNAFDPNNVCGYGGPEEYQDNGGEFLCWQDCINERVQIPAGEGGAGGALPDFVDDELNEECFLACATPADFKDGCDGFPGVATNELTACVTENCGEGICFF